MAWRTPLAAGPRAWFPPAVAIPVGRLAGERPDTLGRSLSPWDGAERARQLMAAALVADSSGATGRRMLASPQLQPWRHHLWRDPKPPRDAALDATVSDRSELDTRPRRDDERVLSVDETPSVPPRGRVPPTPPAQPGTSPPRQAHAYRRGGALPVWAAVAPRAGQVLGPWYPRTRPQECMTCLEPWDMEMAPHRQTVHRVCDHGSTQHGQDVRQWVAQHARVVLPCTPVHGSWMQQVEQWFSILHRHRLRLADCEAKAHLQAKLRQCMGAWHQHAHPFHWSTKSVAQVRAKAPAIAA